MISVLIPNFNKAKWIPGCLQSCLEQGSLLYEIIVVDDHSTDESWDILQQWQINHPSVIKIYKNPNKGANNARNFAFSKATGQYIQWLDSDDYLLPEKFENQIIPLQKSEADIVYSDWRLDHYENDILKSSETRMHRQYNDFLEELLKDNWTSPNNYLMCRDIAEKLAGGIGWNPSTQVGQDREYFTMAGILGAQFQYLPGVFAVYNSQKTGTIAGLPFKERLLQNQKLERRFRNEVRDSVYISKNKKKLFINVLHTHKIKACYYNRDISLDESFSLFDIQWDLIHYKMRFPIFMLFFYKYLQFILKRNE